MSSGKVQHNKKSFLLQGTLTCSCVFVLFISCSGQHNIQFSNDDKALVTIGDTVPELGNNLMHILQDKNNHYLFAGYEDGVYRYDGKSIIHYTTKNGLCHNKIDMIQEDKWGNIFFTTGGGICMYDGRTFTRLSVINNPNEWKLEPDDLWFKGAQDSGVIYRYDGKSLFRLKFPKTELGEEFISKYPRSQFPAMRFNPYDIYTNYKDSKGSIWFGSGTLGVCRYDGKSFNWIEEDDVTELGDGAANGVRSIIEDKDGKFWFSNTLYRHKVEDQNGMVYTREKSIGPLVDKEGGMRDFYMSAVKDDRGDLWMATYGLGVWHYDGNKLTHYLIKEGNNVVTLYSIYKDKKGDLWVGTHEYGVYKFNGVTFERFSP